MARKRDVPNLEDALESGFSELNKGEDNIKIEERPKKIQTEVIEPKYGLKIDSVESREKFISKPIAATKKIVDAPINATENKNVDINDDKKSVKKQKVLDSPTSNIGDDFDVGW